MDLWDFNHVFIPYCTGDLHSGTVTEPSEETFGLYFSGHLVFSAVLDVLLADEQHYGLSSATEVVLSGDSAGGIGVWMNVDYLTEKVRNAKVRSSRADAAQLGVDSTTDAQKIAGMQSVRVVAAPIAGFYFYVTEPYEGPDHTHSTLTNFSASGIEHAFGVWQSFVDADCSVARNEDPWACVLSNYSFPYISSEAFVVEAQTDAVVLENHDWIPSAPALCNSPESVYVAQWRQQMHQALQPLLDVSNPRNGVFSPGCYTHTGFYHDTPLVNNLNYYQAFGNWYFNRTADASSMKIWDECGPELYCNPTCTNPC